MVDTVFDSFPFAIEQVKLVEFVYSTIVGNTYAEVKTIDAIIDEGNSSVEHNVSQTASGIANDTLLYARPEQLPTLDCEELSASYGVILHGKIFSIEDASLGKNQENGTIEHVELKVRQRSAIKVEESE